MSMKEIVNIRAYYDESRPESDGKIKVVSLAEILDRSVDPPKRWPVRNSEIREPISSQKRAIIHERDGGECQYCWRPCAQLVLDHIVPRSAFEARDLRIADRSDNLQSACWDCNERRSNWESVATKRLGVTARCWYCVNPEFEGEDSPELPYPLQVLVFCGRCGVSQVPSVEGWVL